MDFWNASLTTRAGAERAARLGSLISFIAAGRTILGVLMIYTGVVIPFFGGALRADSNDVLVKMLAGPTLGFVVFLVAGIRLRAHKGLVWGGLASLTLVSEVLYKLLIGSLFGVLIDLVMLVVLANGVRGASALRRGAFGDDNLADVFN